MPTGFLRPDPGLDPRLAAFLEPLRVDRDRIHRLSGEFSSVFARLAAESFDQFLPTPISEAILLHSQQKKTGRYLAIDIGGTNLRVGFIELADDATEKGPVLKSGLECPVDAVGIAPNGSPLPAASADGPTLRRLLEHSWPILEHLKSNDADMLFAWIGSCIASVVRQGCTLLGISRDDLLPMGVTFSFPMEQQSLSQALLMAMGKGFAIPAKLDVGAQLIKGYDKIRASNPDSLPPITIAAIANDAVSTLVSFVYEHSANPRRRAIMGIICGTGSNATMLLKRNKLHPSKRKLGDDGDDDSDSRIAVNTEWSINGTAAAMRVVGLISRWDDELSAMVECPGFQPLEYMTAGRYLGELGRIMLIDYMTRELGFTPDMLPGGLLKPFEPRNTKFLSTFRPPASLVQLLEAQFPVKAGGGDGNCGESVQGSFAWTEHMAEALYQIAKAIETRAAAIIAAAIVGLLDFAGELPALSALTSTATEPLELVVGYTGGCITNFQDYLADCQAFLDGLVAQRYGNSSCIRIVLSPCHDGGIKGAGILVPASLAS